MKDSFPRLFRLSPANFTFNVWGGNWIPRLKGLPPGRRPVGESWEFSVHPKRPSVVLGMGRPLPLPVFQKKFPHFLGKKPPRFLVKLIDARDNLSIQVHPADRHVRRSDNESGKAESWLILGTTSAAGGGFIYIGFSPWAFKKFRNPSSLRRAFLSALEETPGTNGQKFLRFLNRVRVQPGEIYDLPPGTIHAIGKGIQLLEIQQSSDVTYRIWDWNRPEKRPLHHREAMRVLDFGKHNLSRYHLAPRRVAGKRGVKEERLVYRRAAGYAAHRLLFSRRGAVATVAVGGKFSVLTVVEGRVRIGVGNGRMERIRKGSTVLVPANVRHFQVVGETPRAAVIRSFSA